jgi:hypothetical protein
VAARGLLERVDEIRNRQARSEFATFVADLYRRASPMATRALAGMDARAQQAAAGAIVATTLALFGEGAQSAIAPWPTRRVPRTALAAESQPGWDAIQGAEAAYRQRLGRSPTRSGP